MTRTTLPEEVYLLAQGGHVNRRNLAIVVRAALLIELSLRDCLVEDGKTVRPSPTQRTGDPLLDDTLRAMSEQQARSWRGWMRRANHPTLAAVRDRLATTGVIEVDRSRALGLFPLAKVTITDPARVTELRTVVRAALEGTGPVPTHDAMLVAILAAGEIRAAVSRRDRRAYADRIAEFTEHGGGAVPALRHLLRQLKAARVAAYSGGS
jgi:hypothetical protein